MSKIKTLLVDDEPLSIKHLKTILTKHCEDLDIVGSASHVEEALEKIITLKPELLFLDIELGGESGFEILKRCHSKKFEVIFVTAHNQFGIDAVKNQALDYILKPINKLELLQSVENAVHTIHKKKKSESLSGNEIASQRLSLPTMEGLIFVDLSHITHIESEGRYSRFHLSDNTKHLVSKNLGEYEEDLEKKGFVRIHHSYIVNLSFVEKYIKGRGGYVILKNGKSLEVSTRKKDDFFEKLN
ncbi:MAG: response regulator transcription factor [Bacteroidetes bacterium]|nr:response regulator transcription factor [Bacteroidota bacterium]